MAFAHEFGVAIYIKLLCKYHGGLVGTQTAQHSSGPSSRCSYRRGQTGSRHRAFRLICPNPSLSQYRERPSRRPCRGKVLGGTGELFWPLTGFSIPAPALSSRFSLTQLDGARATDIIGLPVHWAEPGRIRERSALLRTISISVKSFVLFH